MISVTLYSRKDCHLCDEAKADLEGLQGEIPHTPGGAGYRQRSKATARVWPGNPCCRSRAVSFESSFYPAGFADHAFGCQDRERHIDLVEKSPMAGRSSPAWLPGRGPTGSLAGFPTITCCFLIWCGRLSGVGLSGAGFDESKLGLPANLLYKAYGLVCHQLAYRSFYLFGEQVFLSSGSSRRPAAMTFSQATGLEEEQHRSGCFCRPQFCRRTNSWVIKLPCASAMLPSTAVF